MTPELVLLGNLLVDDVVLPDGSTRMGQPGGAVLYGALAAALWSLRVGCVSLRGNDYPTEALAHLHQRGVALGGIVPLDGPGLRTWLLYERSLRRVLHQLGCPSHEAVSPGFDHLPEGWRAARAFHLGPMPIAAQAELARHLGSGGALVSIDPYELVTEESLPRWRDVLRHAHAFFPSDDEMLLEGAAIDPPAALRRLAGGRLRFVVWKRGEQGGALWDAAENRFHEWSARTHAVVDPTGAGDAFAAGFLTAHLEGRAVPECLQRGVVTASLAVQAWGPDSLLAATPADAQARLREWYGAEVAR